MSTKTEFALEIAVMIANAPDEVTKNHLLKVLEIALGKTEKIVEKVQPVVDTCNSKVQMEKTTLPQSVFDVSKLMEDKVVVDWDGLLKVEGIAIWVYPFKILKNGSYLGIRPSCLLNLKDNDTPVGRMHRVFRTINHLDKLQDGIKIFNSYEEISIVKNYVLVINKDTTGQAFVNVIEMSKDSTGYVKCNKTTKTNIDDLLDEPTSSESIEDLLKEVL